jgi:hypothetical protein
VKTPSRQALAEHVAACQRGDAGYLDPDTNLFVMTSVYLLERGTCCGSGCRHCPYGEEEQASANRPDDPSWPWFPDGVSD